MSIGSVDIYIDAERPPTVRINDNDAEHPFAVLELSPWPTRVYIAIRTVGEADLLIKAALAAHDLLPDVSGDLDAIPPNRIGEPAPTCLSCGATGNLDTVHVPARTGIAARTEHYCHDGAECWDRRHAHETAVSHPAGAAS